jgi:pSer/pThr/pTyr-binding forkhead associated (FHA) protein
MEVTAATTAPRAPTAELVVLNGQQAGTRRPLETPLTLIGRAASCDIRLTVDGIQPLHCMLAFGPQGLLVRDLESETGILVNGERVMVSPLQDGDVLSLGAFEFRLSLGSGAQPELPSTSAGAVRLDADLEAQRDALRVQTAAVAAQQAALVDQEARLQQQQTTLTKQQEQLAAHLEGKRARLERLADQVQNARATYKREQEEQLGVFVGHREELARSQAELEENRKKLEVDRKRVTELRRQLQQRFRRRWLAERQKIRQSEQETAAERKRLEQEQAKLGLDREALTKARLSLNGEVELGKRQLQAQWQELWSEQKQWKGQRAQQDAEFAARSRAERQREDALLDAERALGDDKHQWEQKRKLAEHEVYGLESRINNQRRKLLEQQHEMSRGVRIQESQISSQESEISSQESGASSPLTADSCSLTPDGGAKISQSDVPAAEQQSQRRTVNLDLLAGDLADQRLLLLEHWQRLVETQVQWHQERQMAADHLTALAVGLPHQERVLAQREHALQKTEENLVQRQRELSQLHQHLEAWAARVRLRETTWESERDRLLADIRSREESAEGLRTVLLHLRQRWTKRRKKELDLLKMERLAIEKLRQEYATLRQECWQRCLALDEQQREFSEKNLALQEYRQLFVLRCQDAAGVENKLDRLRKRWVQQNSQLVLATSEHFDRLQAEAIDQQRRSRELLKVTEELSVRGAKLTEQQSKWEEQVATSAAQEVKLRQQLQSVQAQRQRTEQQVAELQAEVERMARVLLDEAEEPPVPLARAA